MGKTAAEAGWHISRYNLSARIPETDKLAIVNLFRGSGGAFTPIECYLLSALDELDEHHPILPRFARLGLIADFDERAVLESRIRYFCGCPSEVALIICPTMACNFDCPYCFEKHRSGRMSGKVQEDIVALAGRMLTASRAGLLTVRWFGGEPLLAPDIIESLSDRLMALASERGVEYKSTIITNGYLFTQDIVDMLGRVRTERAQITVDGISAVHDATRRLAGGGGTFEHIMDNLRSLRFSFPVNVRQNAHEGNYRDYEKLCAYIEQIAQETGNNLSCYPTEMRDNSISRQRGDRPGLLDEAALATVEMTREARLANPAEKCGFCQAQSLWGVAIDDLGNLYKCDEIVDKPDLRFGTAADWDPQRPFESACAPDRLTSYLNSAGYMQDEECRNCVWLPVCRGGCPDRRLTVGKECLGYRNHPEEFVLARYRFLQSQYNHCQ